MKLEVPEIKVPWSGRGMAYTAEEIQTVVDVMQHADPLTQGRYQTEFENAFSAKFGFQHSFAVSSGTAALELAALLCRIRPGDEVIIPAHTFAASALPFGKAGAKLVWADLDPETFLASPKSVESLITSKTKTIVVVHLYGLVTDMAPILDIAKKHRLFIVEDAAQSIGAKYKGLYSGGMGDFGCFSFHGHKNISTLGEGGVLTVKDPELAKLVPGLRHNGMRPYPEPRENYWTPAATNVDFDWDGVWPHNFCIGEVQCALATKMLERLDDINNFRKQRAIAIQSALADYPEVQFQKVPKPSESSYHLLPARITPLKGVRVRNLFMQTMYHDYGVKMAVQYHPLYRYPLFQKAGFSQAQCPETDAFFDNMVSFPFQPTLTEEQVAYMIDCTKRTIDRLRREFGVNA